MQLRPLFTLLASLRVRLIVTYVAVVVISFSFLLVLFIKPVEKFLIDREHANLVTTATVLGSTIPSKYEASPAVCEENQMWNHRRCIRDLTHPRISGGEEGTPFAIKFMSECRYRMLDEEGFILTDSYGIEDWTLWKQQRRRLAPLSKRPEVLRARRGAASMDIRAEDGRPHGRRTMYVAVPIIRRGHVGFIIAISRPVDSIRRDLNELQGYLKLGMVTSLLLTILVGVLLSSHLSQGLINATQVARAFAAGKMDQRMPGRGFDEVGQLSIAFNQMAEALARHEHLRRSLLADVSHELRTPLTAIAGCADTLSDGALRDDPDAAERFLQIITKESARLQRLVQDILELSRLQAGAIDIPRRPIPVLPFIQDAVEIARMQLRQDDVKLVVSIPEMMLQRTRVLVDGNEDRLGQAVRNLLDNARHHTPPGKKIMLSLEVTPREVIIRVKDEGDGIPAEELPLVFDRFYRASKGSKPGGTGLGLAIVREIMQAHDGRVAVDSTYKHGATFSLHLPRVDDEMTG